MDVKSILVVGVIALVYACSGEVTSDKSNGKVLYKMNCASCHGLDGKAGVTGAKDLSTSKLDSSKIYKILIEGKGIMPPFEDILTTEKERNAVVDHIMSLKE